MTTTKAIEGDELQQLRNEGTIAENEIAILEGDLILAKNVLTQERRIIGKATDIITENSKKRILKG
tara:strand:+ start:637 stop:834 length:198 start_codon:yes stop_codon:yes gene_type:complete